MEASVDLADKLDLTTVAEGVETQADWDLVEELGVDLVQGYFVAKPMPGDEMEDWARSWEIRAADRKYGKDTGKTGT